MDSQRQGSVDSALKISALSRPLHLGMLYDTLNDKFIPGISIWKTEDIKRNTHVTSQPNTRYLVSTSESLREKTQLLDVSDSVKLSFLTGMINAGGSAKYLNDKTSSTQQCRVTLSHSETTEVREVKTTEVGAPDPEVLSKTEATHVVTKVLYGADALIEFQQTASDEAEKQKVQEKLNRMINKVPSMGISGTGSLNMNEEDKKEVMNVSCKFYGDFQVKEIPHTFEEAVKVYKQLPSLLGKKGENAVPVKVWLYPLSKLSNTESKLKRIISETIVSAVEKVMDDFHHAEIRTNDLLEKSREIKAEDIVEKLEKFQNSLREFTAEILKKMKGLIPAIRGGTMEETKLGELLNSQNASGFSRNEMGQWLDGKETEINLVTSYIRKLDYEIKSPGHELQTFLTDPFVSDAFVFSFTSLRYEEPYLNLISQTAKNFKSGSPISTPEQNQTEEVPWYRKPEAKNSLDFAYGFITKKRQDSVISFIPDPEHLGASVRWYENADLKAHACYFTMDPNTASKKLLLSEGNRKVTRVKKTQPYPDHPDRFTSYATQVLSTEPLMGRCYWEWEWDDNGWWNVGVANKSTNRKDWIGNNADAWSLEWYEDKPRETRYGVWTGGTLTRVKSPPYGCRRAGVFVDQKAGTVSFYWVSSDILTHVYTYSLTPSDESLYAAIDLSSLESSTLSLV